ncbi:MAG TPA: DUF4276 family protein [Thermoanaerobaculia bacterium]
MGKGYILVEGHGELGAVDNLISRLSGDLGLRRVWAPASRWPNLSQLHEIQRGCNVIRTKGNAEALLILRDEDDKCPKELAPSLAEAVRKLSLSFPTAIVLFHPEYEVLFLPCIDQMAGKTLGTGAAARPGLRPGTRWEGSWESRRGIKEWLSDHFPPNRIYKPRIDQLPLTRLINFDVLRNADLPCFGTLERALGFLAEGGAGEVYPQP